MGSATEGVSQAGEALEAAGSAGAVHLPDAELRRALLEGFGIEATTVEPLGGEYDQNSRVTDVDGTVRFVRVTVTAPGSTDVAWQNSLLQHLEDSVPDLPLPRLVPALDGDVNLTVHTHGNDCVVRVMTWLPGVTMSRLGSHPDALLRELGVAAGRIVSGLSSLPATMARDTHEWDMRRATAVIASSIGAIEDPENAASVATVMGWYDRIEPTLGSLPAGVVHHDLNDANVLADLGADGELHLSGIVDVGDALHSVRVAELAIAAGYAMVRKSDPIAAAAQVIAGFHSVVPLTEAELAAVYPLAVTRLCMNAVTWSRRIADSGSSYGLSRMAHTWPTIQRLTGVLPAFAEASFRQACGLPPTASNSALVETVKVLSAGVEAVRDVADLDLRPASDVYDELDWEDLVAVRQALLELRGARIGHVPHLRASLLRSGRRRPGLDDACTVQLGSLLLLPEGVHPTSRLAGVVAVAARPGRPLVLRHDVPRGALPTDSDVSSLFTCWWGLDSFLQVGDEVPAGGALGLMTGEVDLGGLPALQVQLVGDLSLATSPPPQHIRPADRAAWADISPDPGPLLGLPPQGSDTLRVDDVLDIRERLIARSQRSYYRQPMNLARGRDVWFYDEDGRSYLDSLNNVTHVGHAEPRVTAAATRQMRKLNTNSRFVYPQIASYAEKLVATLPDPLEVVFLVCTGSEANDLALRIARQVTGRLDVVNIDGAYHGNTGVVTGISPNRYKGPGGQGAPATTHEVAMPDRYRGRYGYDVADAGPRYAALAASLITRIDGDGRRPAAFIAESLMGSGGNVIFPDGYLPGVFAAARAAGALCISDEVQVGVGRLGPWWGFELQGVVPDIVTMGKPLGNGHPLAAVVTTRAIADAFDTGMKYFNTFGGNPVSCVIGETVLDIIERDGLRDHAVEVGDYFAGCLRELQDQHAIIGDVRAEGLYLGVELVRDRRTKEPARAEAFTVTERTKERGVVVFPNGVHDNVLKIKPPMTFRREHADEYVSVLDDVLRLPELQVPADNHVRKYL
jgi:4-aminobutyrate aminotransferase-like enzyme/Ser/Thr protein kinase RdoA (MazF antagonist)